MKAVGWGGERESESMRAYRPAAGKASAESGVARMAVAFVLGAPMRGAMIMALGSPARELHVALGNRQKFQAFDRVT